MGAFVDTGVWYAHHDRDAPRHESATGAVETLVSGRYGSIFTSDHVLDEAVTLTRSRTGSYDDSRRIADRILGVDEFPDATELLFVDEGGLEDALDAFDRYRDHPLSFTDATTVALMDDHEIDHLLSFDDDFDGIVDRLDPASL
jgi:predicted nucleic acid-binding protein